MYLNFLSPGNVAHQLGSFASQGSEYLKKSAHFLKDMVSSDLFRTTTFWSAVGILGLELLAYYDAGGALFEKQTKTDTLFRTGLMGLGLGFSTFSAKRVWDHYFPPAVVPPVAPPVDQRGTSEDNPVNHGPFPSIAKGSSAPIQYHYHIHRNGDEEGEEVPNSQAPQARGRARAQSPATKRRSSSRLRDKKNH